MTLVIGKDSLYRHGILVQTWNHGIDVDSWYRHGLMVETWNHGIDMDSWYGHGIMVQTWTQGIDNNNGFDLNSWYRIGTPESHTYKRAKCCPYAGFFYVHKKQLPRNFPNTPIPICKDIGSANLFLFLLAGKKSRIGATLGPLVCV